MRFNSPIFWTFLAAVVAVLWLLPARARKPWLLASSYVFYASWQYKYLLLLTGVAAFANLGGKWVLAAGDDAALRKRRGTLIIAGHVLVLALFKYLDWLVENLNGATGLAGVEPLPLPKWVLPLGVSFYVFEGLSYTLDCIKKKEKAHSFWDFQLYMAFFPHLIAGPILRAKEFFPQLAAKTGLRVEDLREGLWRIATGLFVKIVLADGLAVEIDKAFARDPAAPGAIDIAVMAVGFGLQIYFDFSAYSGIAIGAAKLCGINLVENFNFPFSAQTPADFWNRWHMSLSRWIRDYLFMPFVGKRLTLPAMCKASILAMAICGLWHGANWTFVLWGVYHGVLVAGSHVYESIKRKRLAPGTIEKKVDPALRPFTVPMMVTWVALIPGWILFRAPTVAHAMKLLASLFTPWRHSARALSGTLYAHVALLMLAVWLAPVLARLWDRALEAADRRGRSGQLAHAMADGFAVGVMMLASLVYLKSQTAFIYFQF